MDIVTQGVVGAACAQAFAPKEHGRLAAAVGVGAGVLPDADTLINSAADPLLQLEFHRHFSHALVFVPVGAAVAAVLLWPLLRRRLSFGRLYFFALLGYAPGGLLDACTSYGTHLFWPFAAEPVALSLIAIVDPVFTLALAVPLVWGLRRQRPVRWGLVLALGYLAIGALQHQRAVGMVAELAQKRGHVPQRLLVKPTVANLVLWRGLYVVGDSVWVDAVRLGWERRVYPGTGGRLFDAGRDLDWAPAGSRAYRDAQRFDALSDGMAVVYEGHPQRLGDVRYAMLPTAIAPLWGIELDLAAPQAPPRWITTRQLTPQTRQQFVAMLLGRDLKAKE